MKTTDAYLWAILALLSVALVLMVVTARRGPWTRPPMERPYRLVVGVDPAGGPDDDRIVVVRHYEGLPISHVHVIEDGSGLRAET